MPKMSVSEGKINIIKLYCTCNIPEMIDGMILCENNTFSLTLNGIIRCASGMIMKLNGNVIIVVHEHFKITELYYLVKSECLLVCVSYYVNKIYYFRTIILLNVNHSTI